MASSTLSLAQEAGLEESHYESNASNAITIIFVRNQSDLINPTLKCKPLFTHQIFDNEVIYGYYKLKIDIYVAAHSAQMFVDYYYDDVICNKDKYGLQPDDIMGALQPWFPNNLSTDVGQFSAHINKSDRDYTFGVCINYLHHKDEEGVEASFCIVNCDIKNAEFKKFHQRFQSLIIMYIDAANFIDLDDENWKILYLYEKCNINGKMKLCPVGFCTIYLLESTVTVARISQFFIVPFLQKLGLGYKLLDTTYKFLLAKIPNLDEITVEKPNKIFNRMKDNLDISLIINDPVFSKENLFKECTDEMIFRCRGVYKFSNDQSKKIYEILRYYYARHDKTQKQACIDYIVRNRYLKYIEEDEAKTGTMYVLKSKDTKRVKLTSQPIDYIRKKFYIYNAEKEGHNFSKKVKKHLEYIERHFGNGNSSTVAIDSSSDDE